MLETPILVAKRYSRKLMVSYIAQLEDGFWEKMKSIERGQGEMTYEYAYDFVFFLSEMFFGLTYEAEKKRKDYWLSLSEPEWITIIVHNLINFDYTERDKNLNPTQQQDFQVTWESQAEEVLSDLLDRYGPDYIPLLTPLLLHKTSRANFFSLLNDCYFKYDVIDLVSHFVEPNEALEGWEIEDYIYLLRGQDAERAIPLLEAVRRNYSGLKVMVYFDKEETVDTIVGQCIESINKGNWIRPEWSSGISEEP